MINQVGSFIDQTFVCSIRSFDHCFDSFLTYFLSDLVDSGFEQAGGVRTLGHFFVTFVNEILQCFQEHNRFFVFLTPASICACMTNRTCRICLDQQGIVVTIRFDRYHMKEVAAFFSFRPKTIFGTAEESYFSGFHRFIIGFLIHKAQHQDFACLVVLYDSRNKSVHLIEIQFHLILSSNYYFNLLYRLCEPMPPHPLMVIPSPQRYDFNSGILISPK